jgi:hypothetical protein
MVLQVSEQSRLENPRNYASGVVDELRGLLAAGGKARPDARRANFYEVENGEHIFYVHVSPISGNVVLLAKWSQLPQHCCSASARQTA